jgi:hypothetical protein
LRLKMAPSSVVVTSCATSLRHRTTSLRRIVPHRCVRID